MFAAAAGDRSARIPVYQVGIAVALVLAAWAIGRGGAAALLLYRALGAVLLIVLAVRWSADPERGAGGPAGAAPRGRDLRSSARGLAAPGREVDRIPVGLVAGVFLALAATSIITSMNRGVTAVALADLAVGVTLLLAASRVATRAAVPLVFIAVVTALPIAASAILEPLGGGWLPDHDLFPGRAIANMGGPGPLGAFLAALLPLALAFAVVERRRRFAVLARAASALLFLAIVATFSRAALVASAAGAASLWFFLSRSRAIAPGDSRWRTRLAALLLVGALLVPAYNALATRLAPDEFGVGERPGTQTFELRRSPEEGELTNAAIRVRCWRTAARMITRYPATGVGAGCFGIAFEASWPDDLRRFAARHGFGYRFAYDDYLQLAAELGLPALTAFLLLLLVVVRRGTRRLASARAAPGREHETPAHSIERRRATALAALLAALVVLLTQALVDFPLHVPSPAALLWIFLGLVLALARPQAAPTERPVPRGRRTRTGHAGAVFLAVAGAALLAAAIAAAGILPYLAERAAADAVTRQGNGQWEEATASARRAVRFAPHEHDYWVLLGETRHKALSAGSPRADALPLVFDAYRHAIASHRNHGPTYGRLGALYLAHGETVPGARDSARAYLERAIALNPHFADPHTNLGTVLAMAGEIDLAERESRIAARLDTLSPDPHFNLGNLSFSLDDTTDAAAHYRAALARDSTHFGTLTNLGLLRFFAGREDEARRLVERALEAHPDAPQAEEVRELLPDLTDSEYWQRRDPESSH